MFVLWQMLLPYSVWQILLPIFVEDVKPHIVFQLFATSVMADVIAQWQMEWPLQGDFIQLWQM